jgi:hypothetical protein
MTGEEKEKIETLSRRVVLYARVSKPDREWIISKADAEGRSLGETLALMIQRDREREGR